MVQVAYFKRDFGKGETSFARQINRNKMAFEDVLALMGKQTGLSEADMRSVFDHFFEHLALFLPQGHSIQTPLGIFSLSVRQPVPVQGAFVDSQNISTEKVQVRLRCDQTLLNRVKAQTTLQVVDTPSVVLPTLLRAETTESGGFNRGLPGEVLHLVGSRLKFAPEDTTSGVFFIDSTGNQTRATVYSRVGSKRVDVKVPALTPGEYHLEVRTTTIAGDVRAGRLGESFTVLS